MSAPFCSKSVANEWRKVCGVIGFVIPAARAYFRTNRCIDLGVNDCSSSLSRCAKVLLPACNAMRSIAGRCLGAKVRLSCDINKYGFGSARFSKYFCSQYRACSDKNTTRDFRPLPMTVNSSFFRFTLSFFSLASSETRRPVLKSSSSMALSLYLINSVFVVRVSYAFRFSTFATALPKSI